MTEPPERTPVSGLFPVFLRLGLTSFGGPTAHIGYYREAFILRRRWLTEQAFADLVAVAQLLPGPTSSQVGMSLGALRGGARGAVTAWVGFALPSALLMIAFAFGVAAFGAAGGGWLAGLKLAALAVVANAVLGMARSPAPDQARATIAVGALALVAVVPGFSGQLAAIALGTAAGLVLYRGRETAVSGLQDPRVSRRFGILCLVVFALLLVGLPSAGGLWDAPWLHLVSGLYRTGALVFGGGHVVLPLLETVVVPSGWLDRETFVAGYGAAQALPGPLFAVAGFIGASMASGLAGAALALAALAAIFLPGFLLVLGALPFWARLRGAGALRGAVTGIGAAVVGLLGAALYHPVWTSAVHGPADLALVLAGFVALNRWHAPSWVVVGALALVAAARSSFA